MRPTLLTPEAKEALRKRVRGLRARVLDVLSEAVTSEYQLGVAIEKARLSEARRFRRERLEAWLSEQARGARGGKAEERRFLDQAVEEAAHTLLNRLVFVRILEHHGLIDPPVLTGGWRSTGYASEFLQYAGPLAQDDAKGYRDLLGVVFDELAIELPGLFGHVGLTALFPIPAAVLREVVEALDDPALATAWGDDTTLGWVYQYWNDPAREALDAKLANRGKIEPHEIASKTQMFTERYMVEWLLQNSLGLTWLCICKKNGWVADADRVLPDLDRRRAEWRARRERKEVELDALMPIGPGLESDWKYFVPQPIPDDAVAKARGSIAEVKLLDPACGSGHFLVIAFGLLARMYEEEARHRGASWTPAEIAARIVADNLHGIDIDARAIQIAAAALWLRAKLYAKGVRLSRMNLVAPSFGLASLPKDDPARKQLEDELASMGVPRATTARLVDSLKGVDHLGTLLRVDREIGALLNEAAESEGPLFVHGAKKERARLEERVAAFLDAHAAESDLGLRLEGEQLAAGVRFVELAKEGRYDVVVGNPPYEAISKTTSFDYVAKSYPRGKADLYAAFLERGLELVREGGISALVTMRGWMFLGQFSALRAFLLHASRHSTVSLIADVDTGAFEEIGGMVVSAALSVVFRTARTGTSLALRATKETGCATTSSKRAGLLAHVGRYEFDPHGFAVIEGEPIVYWWPKDFLAKYAAVPKLGQIAPVRQGAASSNNARFLRRPWEIRGCFLDRSDEPVPLSRLAWVPYVKGAEGRAWYEPVDDCINWVLGGLEVRVLAQHLYGSYTRTIKNENWYFVRGVAFASTGSRFSARVHRYRGVFDVKGQSVFSPDPERVCCIMNSAVSREVLSSLNPSISFQVGDANRLPMFHVCDSGEIFSVLDNAFTDHERARESSVEFREPGLSGWRHAQVWAQLAVDRPRGAPLPVFCSEYDQPETERHLSFAIGVALGRFGANGEGILDQAPPSALPGGILFVGPSGAYSDSLAHDVVFQVLATAWETYVPAEGRKPALRDWLRKDFFAFHKELYENRPIYFPLSSEKRSFVAWISIHRWTNVTLTTLLADHLNPVLRQLDAEIRDVNAARASSDKKTAAAADKQYGVTKRLRDELADFIVAVTACAERGAPPTDPKCPPRERDAPFVMDLDDGVMINSAALWPLLAPQWSDPKKWWKQLCKPEGRKDYDWAHLAKRYFPTRVEAKCKKDPSLAVAHGCFWKYHPAKAFAWELRLQDEIRPDFTIDEAGSDEGRAAWLAGHPDEAEAAREKELVRRERKAARVDDAEDADDAAAGEENGDAPPEEDA